MRAVHRLIAVVASVTLVGAACARSGTELPSSTLPPVDTATSTSLPPIDTTTSTTLPPVDTTTTTLPTSLGPMIVHGLVVGEGEPAIGFFDPDTGAITELVDALSIAEGAGHLFLDPSANLLYFSRNATSCSNEILTVDVATGLRKVVASGTVPVVSPDGRFLAYSQDPTCRAHDEIHIRDLTDGTERVWASELDESSELPAVVIELSWSSDSRTLAAEILFEDGTEIRLLDASADGGLIFAEPRLSGPPGRSWTSPLYANDGRLLVAETIEEQPRKYRIVSVNPDNGQTTVLAVLDEPARLVDVHPTSGQILFTSAASRFDVDLWTLDGTTATFVTAGVSDAVWLPDHGTPISQS